MYTKNIIMKHCYVIPKSLFILFLLLCTVAESFAGDGSKDNPYSFQEFMSLIKSSNSDIANNKWINSYMGIYKAYSTVISSGGMKTEEYTKLVLTDKPGIIYSSRQPSQYTTNSFVMVYGDDIFEDNPSISSALNNNKSMKMLAHCSSHWKHAQGYYVVDVDIYEIDEINEISGACGDNLTWTFLEETKTLTISGTGDMWDYRDSYFTSNITTPWSAYIQDIKNVVLEDGVSSIGVCAFYGCSNIETIKIANSVTKIGRYALMNCNALIRLELPDNLVSIGDQAFFGCSSLTSVIIPKSVSNIENDMLFGRCNSLTSIIVEEGNPQYDSRDNCNAIIVTAFDKLIQGCNGTKIPNGITEICRTAFCGSRINSITIPNSVTKIGYEAFNWCQELATVVVGNGVTAIGDDLTNLGSSFGSCLKLKDFYLYAINIPYTKDNTFNNTNIENAVLHVPINLVETYRTTAPWSGFKEIVALTDSDPKPEENTSEDDGREAYAVLSEASKKLTFYYDKYKEFRGGISIEPVYYDKGNVHDYVPTWFEKSSEIRTVIFEDSFAEYTNVTSTASWFWGCDNLVEILGLRNLNTENVRDMSSMFAACEKLSEIDVSNFDTKNVKNMSYMFGDCRNLTILDLSRFNTAKVEDMSYMFSDCVYLYSLNIKGFNTSTVTDMSGMFSRCSKLSNIDVSGFDTSNVTSMSGLFSGCSGLKSIDVSGFNTSNVTNMAGLFSGCSSLSNIDLSGFNTSKVDNMASMFSGCSSLTNIDVSGFNTSNATNMNGMFSGCYGLNYIDVSRFDTSKVKSMFEMFAKCGSITSLDLSSFKTANLTTMVRMFWQCTNLTTIYVSEGWSTDMISRADDGFSSFFQCYKLVGGQGTKYDSSHTDYIYARIDGGTASPGYFTYKENTGVNGVCIDDASVVENVFDVNGHKHDGYVRGLNIVRMSNGMTMKVVMK